MIPQQPWARLLCIPRNHVSQRKMSALQMGVHIPLFSSIMTEFSVLEKLFSHVNPGPNPVSDTPSSVHHGQTQRRLVQRKEVTGEFPAFSAVLNHLYETYLSPRELGESPGDMESCISHCQLPPLALCSLLVSMWRWQLESLGNASPSVIGSPPLEDTWANPGMKSIPALE